MSYYEKLIKNNPEYEFAGVYHDIGISGFKEDRPGFQKMMKDGQYLGLMAGANTVTIHDGTPEEFHKFFPIYSAKRVRPQLDHFKEIVERAGLVAKFTP